MKGGCLYLHFGDKEIKTKSRKVMSQGHVLGKWQSSDLSLCVSDWKVHILHTLSAYQCVLSFCKQKNGSKSIISLFSPPALSSSKGEFLLNGDFVVTMSKREIRIGNAVIEYSGSDNVVERINSTGRIEQELLLQVKTWPWAHAPFLIPWIATPTSILSIFSAHSRCCRWESYTTPMCAILSIFLLKTNPNSFTGTVMDPGKHAANPAKVSTFRLSLGD